MNYKSTGWFGAALAACVMLFATGCNSIVEEPLATDISFEELETRMKHAVDPDGRFAGIKSYYQKQVVTTDRFFDDPEEQHIEVRCLKPDSIVLTTSDYESGESPLSSLIINGRGGWSVDYKRKKIQQLDEEQLKFIRRLLQMDTVTSESRLSDNFAHVELTACRIDGKEFYKLVCTPKHAGAHPVTIYVGKHDFLIRRIKTTYIIHGSEVEYDSTIQQYAMRDGVRTPVRTTVTQNGQTQRTQVIDYKLNPVFSDREFRPPVF